MVGLEPMWLGLNLLRGTTPLGVQLLDGMFLEELQHELITSAVVNFKTIKCVFKI